MPADLGLPDWEASWPQRRERRPRFVDPYYLHYSALVASLAAARDRYVTAPARILDIGCGEMPYYPLFAPVAAEYVGTDIEPGPNVTHVCPIEALEIDDASFDVVLCTQVLEHSRDPAQALREIARVLKPGGYAFATTHGIWPFHPYPVDLWRWTQQGLEALVADTPGLVLQDVVPHRGSASTVALMIGYYVDIVTRRRFLAPVRWAAISALNVAGLAGDRVRRIGYPNNDTLIHNFLVVGRREGEPG